MEIQFQQVELSDADPADPGPAELATMWLGMRRKKANDPGKFEVHQSARSNPQETLLQSFLQQEAGAVEFSS